MKTFPQLYPTILGLILLLRLGESAKSPKVVQFPTQSSFKTLHNLDPPESGGSIATDTGGDQKYSQPSSQRVGQLNLHPQIRGPTGFQPRGIAAIPTPLKGKAARLANRRRLQQAAGNQNQVVRPLQSPILPQNAFGSDLTSQQNTQGIPQGLFGGINPSGLAGVPVTNVFNAGGLAGLTGGAGGLGSLATNPTNSGNLLNVLSGLGTGLGRRLGLSGVLEQAGAGGAQVSSPFGGIPAVPGFNPVSRNFDVMGMIGALTKRAFNGSSVAQVLPPERLQEFSNNVTDSLVPELGEIDLSKYMGRWFEGVMSPKATSQRCIVHQYGGLTDNNKTATFTALKIYREGSEFGEVRYSIGYAFRGGRHQGMLQMHSSEAADPLPYWIYMVGPVGEDPFGNPQYEYAVVSNWIKYPLTVLVRDPDKFQKEYYVDVLRWLEDHKFITDFSRAFNLVQPTDYSNCQYEDSTFAAFGK